MPQELDYPSITSEEVEVWITGEFANFAVDWLHQILNGEYPLEKAREDILSFREPEDSDE